MAIMVGGSKAKLYIGTTKVKKAYLGTTQIYSSGSTVTYVIDSGNSVTKEYDEGASVLGYTPSKSGWTFAGWRENTTASNSVLTSKVMGDTPITLYAIFMKTITLSYNANGGSGSVSAQSGYQYYNNGNISNPSFTIKSNGFTRSNYNFVQWRLGSTSGTAYSAGTSITLSANNTLYAEWRAAVLNAFDINNPESYNTEYLGISGFANGSIHGGAYVNNSNANPRNRNPHEVSASIQIKKLAPYTKVEVEFALRCDNLYESDRRIKTTLSGLISTEYDTYYSYGNDTINGHVYSISSTGTISAKVKASISNQPSGVYTYVDGYLSVKSIKFK